jgi:hypothetical protein
VTGPVESKEAGSVGAHSDLEGAKAVCPAPLHMRVLTSTPALIVLPWFIGYAVLPALLRTAYEALRQGGLI